MGMRTLPGAVGVPTDVTAAAPVVVPGEAILDDPITARVLYQAWSGDPAVVVPSPPGAGKTRLVMLLAVSLAERAGLRVAVAAQTREQAAEIARRMDGHTKRAGLMWPNKHPRPNVGARVAVHKAGSAAWPSDGGAILVGTTKKWHYCDPSRLACDVMIVDEAWQATYADVGALGALAGQIVCVGDPGQIDPVVTGATGRWAGSASGPHRPAPEALVAAHGDAVGRVALRHTWRLGPVTTRLIQPLFYPDLPFTSRRPPEHLSAPDGSALPEISHRQVLTTAGIADPVVITTVVQRVNHLLDTADHHAGGQSRTLMPSDVAVVCPHVAQAAAVRAALADHPSVLVGTAHQLQGLERPAVIALHPMVGYRTAEDTALDTGKACVMLSRHRTHLTVITDTASRPLLTHADDPRASIHAALLDALHATPTAELPDD